MGFWANFLAVMVRAFFAINNSLVGTPKRVKWWKPSRRLAVPNRSKNDPFLEWPKTTPVFLPLILRIADAAVQQLPLPFLNTFVDKPAVKVYRGRIP